MDTTNLPLMSVRAFTRGIAEVKGPVIVVAQTPGELKKLGIWTPMSAVLTEPMVDYAKLSFKNAEGVELFDGSIPAPMRETVRTVETRDLPGGRLRESQTRARTTITLPAPAPNHVKGPAFNPAPKPGSGKAKR